jgi:hypothetical protein
MEGVLGSPDLNLGTGILTAHLQKPLILSDFTPHGITAAGFTNATETWSNCTFIPAEFTEFWQIRPNL